MKVDWEYLEDEKDRLEQFASLAELPSYMWINRKGQPVDIRRMPLLRLTNLRDWMLSHSYRETPYDDTPQFKCVLAAIERAEARFSVARNALRRRA